MSVTVYEPVMYNWFEWPNIISFLIAMLGLLIAVTIPFIALKKDQTRLAIVAFIVGGTLVMTGVIWGITEESNHKIVYEQTTR